MRAPTAEAPWTNDDVHHGLVSDDDIEVDARASRVATGREREDMRLLQTPQCPDGPAVCTGLQALGERLGRPICLLLLAAVTNAALHLSAAPGEPRYISSVSGGDRRSQCRTGETRGRCSTQRHQPIPCRLVQARASRSGRLIPDAASERTSATRIDEPPTTSRWQRPPSARLLRLSRKPRNPPRKARARPLNGTQRGGPHRNFQTDASGLKDVWPTACASYGSAALGEGYLSPSVETASFTPCTGNRAPRSCSRPTLKTGASSGEHTTETPVQAHPGGRAATAPTRRRSSSAIACSRLALPADCSPWTRRLARSSGRRIPWASHQGSRSMYG